MLPTHLRILGGQHNTEAQTSDENGNRDPAESCKGGTSDTLEFRTTKNGHVRSKYRPEVLQITDKNFN